MPCVLQAAGMWHALHAVLCWTGSVHWFQGWSASGCAGTSTKGQSSGALHVARALCQPHGAHSACGQSNPTCCTTSTTQRARSWFSLQTSPVMLIQLIGLDEFDTPDLRHTMKCPELLHCTDKVFTHYWLLGGWCQWTLDRKGLVSPTH